MHPTAEGGGQVDHRFRARRSGLGVKRFYRQFLRRVVPARLLARVKHLSHADNRLYEAEARRARVAELWLRERYPDLFAGGEPVEFSVFSQNGEDGILLDLLRRIGPHEKTFVEIGVENGRECNTAMLGFVLNWNGLMLEAEAHHVDEARRFASYMLRGKTNRVDIRQAVVTVENVNALIEAAGFEGDLGLLSIDVDGMDYWLWKAVQVVRPAVVAVEYNASFGAERSITVPYKEHFDSRREHASGWYHGASLAALEKLGRERGYVLAATDSCGVNAFFARDDAGIPGGSASELFHPHLERSKIKAPAEQWAEIRGLPFVEV